MVISTVNRVVYNGDGITTAWPYTFRIIDATDIKLTIVDADGAETPITADYYVDTINNTVYYPGYAPGAEPPEADQPPKVQSGQKIVVYREIPMTQLANLGDKWPFQVIELGLDKLTMILQQMRGWWGRSFKVSVGTMAEHPTFDTNVPIEAGKTFRVKDDGSGFEVAEDPEAASKEARDAADDAEAARDEVVEVAEDLGEKIDELLGQDGLASYQGQQEIAQAIAGITLDMMAKATAVFSSVAAMKAAPLLAGATVITKGYYAVNDGGAGKYTIRAKTAEDVVDNGSIIELDNGNVAELITDGVVNVRQFGAKGDGVTDDTTAIQNAIDYAETNISSNAVIVVPSVCKVTSLSITNSGTGLKKINFIGGGGFKSVESYLFTTSSSGYVGNLVFENIIFESVANNGHTIISGYPFLNCKWINCVFKNVDSLIKSDYFVQSMQFFGCTISGGYGFLIETNAGADDIFDSCLVENRKNGIVKQVADTEGYGLARLHITITKCCIESITDCDYLMYYRAGVLSFNQNYVENVPYVATLDITESRYSVLFLKNKFATCAKTAWVKITNSNNTLPRQQIGVEFISNHFQGVPIVDLSDLTIPTFSSGLPKQWLQFIGNNGYQVTDNYTIDSSNTATVSGSLEFTGKLPFQKDNEGAIYPIMYCDQMYAGKVEGVAYSLQHGELIFNKTTAVSLSANETKTVEIDLPTVKPFGFWVNCVLSDTYMLHYGTNTAYTKLNVTVQNQSASTQSGIIYLWCRARNPAKM